MVGGDIITGVIGNALYDKLKRTLRVDLPSAPEDEYSSGGIGSYRKGLGQRHRFLREEILQIDPRRMADFYEYECVEELESYEYGEREFPAVSLAHLRKMFFVNDSFLRGVSSRVFTNLYMENEEAICGLFDEGFKLHFLCCPTRRRDLLTYPYLHKIQYGFSRSVKAHRLSSFSPASGGGAVNIYDVLHLMVCRGMPPDDVRILMVPERTWGRLEHGSFHLTESDLSCYWTDRECKERFLLMYGRAKSVREELESHAVPHGS